MTCTDTDKIVNVLTNISNPLREHTPKQHPVCFVPCPWWQFAQHVACYERLLASLDTSDASWGLREPSLYVRNELLLRQVYA